MSQNAGFAPSNFPGGFVQTLTGDIGGPVPPTGGNINVIAGVATLNAGSSVEISGNPGTSTLTFNVTDLNDNTLIGLDAGKAGISGTDNTGLGFQSLSGLTTGLFNTAIGSQSGFKITTGSNNTLLGVEAGGNLLTGSSNIIIGDSSGLNYTGAESDNIIIDNDGVLGETHTIRIGEEGFHTSAYMAGITGVTVSNAEVVVINSVTGQLGIASGGGTPIDTITGNDGIPESPSAGNFNIVTANATPKFLGSAATETLDFSQTTLALGSSLPSLAGGVHNAAFGQFAMASLTSGSSNVAVGWSALTGITTGGETVAVGNQAMSNATYTGSDCTAVGNNALRNATSCTSNAAFGTNALTSISTGSTNTAIGSGSLDNIVTGSNNVAVGALSGNSYTGSESNNIVVGNQGLAGESNIVRIGVYGSGSSQQNKCFIASAFSNFGTQNTFVGEQAGNTTLTIGSSIGNTSVGYQTLQTLTTGAANTCIGQSAGTAITTGTHHTAIGLDALDAITGGTDCVVVGDSSGTAYTTTESNNIILGANITGTLGESNKIRIGNASSNACFITGIDGVNVGSVARVVTEASNQLGTAIITAGTGITITPSANVITISASGTTSLSYTNVSTTPYVVLSTDEYLSVDTSALAITVQLPNAATSGRVFIIKDRTGAAATRNITVTTVGGAVNIDGATSFVMNNNFQSIQVMGNGSTYEIF